MATPTEEPARQGLANGAVESLIGGIDACVTSNMPADDATRDILTKYEQLFELLGTGEIRDGKPHLHVVLGKEGDVALAGHHHEVHVKTYFVKAYVMPL